MIVTQVEDGFRVVTQADHARLAAEILALFRLPELTGHPRRAELLFAVAEHDNGWWEADAAPRLDPKSGGPLDFRGVAHAERLEIWRRGVARHAALRPYAAALLANHFFRLLTLWHREGEDRAALEEFQRLRDEHLAASGRTAAELAADEGWLELADTLSLALCADRVGPFCCRDLRAEIVFERWPASLRLDPFPLAGATRFEVPSRTILRAPYPDAVALGMALAAARWQPFIVRIAPGPSVGR
jgi:hypothetical protein